MLFFQCLQVFGLGIRLRRQTHRDTLGVTDDARYTDDLLDYRRGRRRNILRQLGRVLVAVQDIVTAVVRIIRISCKNSDLTPVKTAR